MVAQAETKEGHKSAAVVVADPVEGQNSVAAASAEGLSVSLEQPFQCLVAPVGYGLTNGTP